MEILSMNVVVSAIVDPWVTTLSFVVALAMRIQGQILQILCRNQARGGRVQAHPGACRAHRPSGEKPRPLPALSHKKARYPHEVDTGRKARTGRGVLLVVACGCLSCGDSGTSIGSVWPRPVGECWVIIALLDSKLEGLGAELLPLVDLI